MVVTDDSKAQKKPNEDDDDDEDMEVTSPLIVLTFKRIYWHEIEF